MQFLGRLRNPSQLHELYISCSLRSLAGSLFNAFTLYFLWQSGFSLAAVVAYQTLFYGIRIPVNFIASHVISWLGPKHAIALSNVIHILFMFALLNIGQSAWLLLPLAALATTAGALYWSSYRVYISKATHTSKSGRQIGWIYSLEAIAKLSGILLGGLLAHFFDPRVTIVTAIAILAVSLLPFLLSGEPITRHRKPSYKGLWSKMWANKSGLAAAAGSRLSYASSQIYWTLYIAITVFTTNAYGVLGLLLPASLFLAIFAAIFIGRLTDKGKSYLLLRWGVAGEIALSLSQIVISSPLPVIIHGLVKENIDKLHVIPINKGIADEADSFGSQRVEYITVVESAIMFGQVCLGLTTLGLMQFFDHLGALRIGVVLAGFASLLILAQRYKTLSRRQASQTINPAAVEA